MKLNALRAAIASGLLVASVVGAPNAAANELGGVNFDWTYLSSGNAPHQGRFTNRNSTCKLVTWYAATVDGISLTLPTTSRMEGNTTMGVQIPSSASSADVRMTAVRDC